MAVDEQARVQCDLAFEKGGVESMRVVLRHVEVAVRGESEEPTYLQFQPYKPRRSSEGTLRTEYIVIDACKRNIRSQPRVKATLPSLTSSALCVALQTFHATTGRWNSRS